MELLYHMPTKICFGTECVAKNGGEFSRWGKQALIVTGRRSGQVSGALGDIQQVLDRQAIGWTVFDQVEENPTFATVAAGCLLARQAKADMVIGIGGGSPLDAAKAVAVLAVNDIAVGGLFDGNFPVQPLPVFAVPITAGTGSEVTPYSVLVDTERRTKRSLSHAGIFPKVAFLDARYTNSLPWPVTVNTALDALSHSLEGYVSKKASLMSDSLALESIRCFSKTVPALTGRALSLEDREQLLYASMLGGMVVAQTGTTMIHSLGYSLTIFRDIPHGRANGLLLAEYLRFLQPVVPAKVTSLLGALGLRTVDEFKAMNKELLGAPETLTSHEVEEFARAAIKTPNIANTLRQPSLEELKQILTDSVPVTQA
ncbi:MAG: iron-containing alcohol dehydrogenase family protein [Negativicutes bacterium]|nr:iron-containing alcohol dehydrogenase family protein [Negativicutes bacterium]